MKLLLMLLLAMTFISCRPDQEETSYDQMQLDELSSDDNGLSCEGIDDFYGCMDSPLCQPIFEPGDTTYYGFISCTDYAPEDPEDISLPDMENLPEEIVEDNSSEEIVDSGSSSNGGNSSSGNGSSSNNSSENEVVNYEDHSCGKENQDNKVKVCHFPPGNPDNAHIICVSINGWENGLSRLNDGMNYLGNCKKSDVYPE